MSFTWSHQWQEQKFTSSVVSQLQDFLLVCRRGTAQTRVNNFVLFFQNPDWLQKSTDELEIHNWSFCPFISLQGYYGCWGCGFLAQASEAAHTCTNGKRWSVNAPRPNIKNCQIHAAGTLPALANARTCSASKGIMWRKRNGSQSS